MTRSTLATLIAGAFTIGMATTALAGGNHERHEHDRGHHHAHADSFQRIATLANYRNNADIAEETVSEIIAATQDGMTLVYTDSPLEQIGFIDITDPADPQPAGVMAVGGEPTSVDVLGNEYALVAVNTSASYTSPGGKLVVVRMDTHAIVAELDLGGQPDSLKISPDGRYAAIAIENERDEDITVDGVEGGLPQYPAGYLVIVDLVGEPAAWTRRDVSMSGLAAYGSDDPEPEFVDINADNQAVVSMQENNHLAIVDLASGTVVADFPAGTVDLTQVDTVEEDIISLTGSLAAVPREPDGITWVPTADGYVVGTANEGDLFGGSRGFSLFGIDGSVKFDSGNSFDHLAVRMGHYPEGRSENKGSEPEAIEFGHFGHTDYVFVGSERGSFVAAYKMKNGTPEFAQFLPAPLGPEGLLAIPSRNLLVASGEEDDPSYGVRSSVMIYKLQPGEPTYPQIVSANDENGTPIPWSALSGMVSLPGKGDRMLAVWDSFYAESRIFTIDASSKPAVITDALTITGGTGNYDPEGIAIAPDRTLWIASEGNASGSRPNRLLQLDTAGHVMAEIGLPQAILDCRAASTATGTLGSGFEGVAVLPHGKKGYKLVVAQQRGWDYTTPECEDLDDDAAGLNAKGQPNLTRLWIYDPKTGDWSHIAWELAELPVNASWVGLSEVTRTANGDLVVIERDNRTGDFAELKTLVKVRKQDLKDGMVSAGDKNVLDILPAMKATHGWVSDKPEGVAISRGGKVYLVTDNDGVDDWSGETSFLELGRLHTLFR